jgi:lipopolysaccharide transport system permease protein
VVFPLEVLSIVSTNAAVFHASASFGVLLIALLATNGLIHWTVILLPIVLLPLMLVALGASWILASVGTYVRDVGQGIGLFTTLLMFLSPVFYPISAVPERFQGVLKLNPLTFIIEQARTITVYGELPDLVGLFVYTAVSTGFLWLGYFWFQHTRRGFADVL